MAEVVLVDGDILEHSVRALRSCPIGLDCHNPRRLGAARGAQPVLPELVCMGSAGSAAHSVSEASYTLTSS